ncbi:GxxExxY protein [Dysgonomonas sp. 520]|uniref:GxxExxY protein n=1 Tax=Dysgonomonas sp. 520 TaxID=2302931 RepID=UPI0013D88522|nr:GxxExxY protein [Dysgonomonas sp. 520]NDW09044.1 GxxExxY protein [Dysgonomonas sp. 520]
MVLKERYEEIGKHILDASIEVHRELGPGLLESVYEICLCEELRNRNLEVKSQVELPVFYKGQKLDKFFKIDILVENLIIIELKSCELLHKVDEVQLVTYLKLTDLRLGYLINFNVALLKEGIKRKVNNYFIS